MNLLIDVPPNTVMIGDTEYRINSDFRVSVLFELLIQDDDVSDAEKILNAVELYFPEPPNEDINDILKAIVWFYKCGRTDKERHKKDDEDAEQDPSVARAYSFDYDDEYIYAAFRQQYGINLATVEGLHWWEFRAMFKSLDSKCEFCRIMGYRTTKINPKMSKEEKAFLRRMKSAHALPESERAQREHQELVDVLMNGGDVASVLNKRADNYEEKRNDAC